MKVLILGGFLGSGKTSLLLQLAYYMTGHLSGDKKYQVVILENEIGEEGIDDKLLRGNGYQVENLFSGLRLLYLIRGTAVICQQYRKAASATMADPGDYRPCLSPSDPKKSG